MERDFRGKRGGPRLGSWWPRAPRWPRPPGWAAGEAGFGPGGPVRTGRPTRFGGRSGRGGRVRKGDVRAAIFDLLAEGGQWNGYQLIQEIAGGTSGVWRPSAGSVYPALQQLEDEGLIGREAKAAAGCTPSTRRAVTYARRTRTS